MREVINQAGSTRFVLPIAGVPDAQARALDRRHRLAQQQRSFRGPHPAIAAEMEPASGRLQVMSEA